MTATHNYKGKGKGKSKCFPCPDMPDSMEQCSSPFPG